MFNGTGHSASLDSEKTLNAVENSVKELIGKISQMEGVNSTTSLQSAHAILDECLKKIELLNHPENQNISRPPA